VIFLTKIIQN